MSRIDTGITHEDGVYFGMQDEEYHAIPALSASGIKNLLISPMEFWACSWLNPERQESDTTAKEMGKAYHTRILEGKDAFYSLYAAAFDKSQYDALETAEELKEACKALGLKISGSKQELAARVRDADPSQPIMDDLRERYASENAGKRQIPLSLIKSIEISAYMISKDPSATSCFKGGYPEVTVIWTSGGVPMKARFDYLKIKAICDLKTFSNPQGKSIYNAIGSAMAGRKYHLQAANYMQADGHARRFVREGRVFGSADPAWLKAYAEHKEPCEFYFVFQQTGHAPITRVMEFSRALETFKIAEVAISQAKQKFKHFYETYGEDPWLDLEPLGQMEDGMFPLYMLEI